MQMALAGEKIAVKATAKGNATNRVGDKSGEWNHQGPGKPQLIAFFHHRAKGVRGQSTCMRVTSSWE